MTNTLELELAIKRANITKRDLAKKLGISEMALYNKISNHAEFKASEIVKLQEVLKLSTKQRDVIFFAV